MTINLEILIGAAQELNEHTATYFRVARNIGTKWSELTDSEQTRICTGYLQAGHKLYDLCKLIGVDLNKVYKLGRAARKYEQRNKWEKCFPANQNRDRILKFIAS